MVCVVSFPDRIFDEFPAQIFDGFSAQIFDGFPAQIFDGFPGQIFDGFPGHIFDGFPGQILWWHFMLFFLIIVYLVHTSHDCHVIFHLQPGKKIKLSAKLSKCVNYVQSIHFKGFQFIDDGK